MKRLIFVMLLLATISSCQEVENPSQDLILTESEVQTLLFMREEEKLAHDVYAYSFEKYDVPIFQNIANSESKHVLSVLKVMESFQLADPLNGSTIQGEFTNLTLSNLYSELISRVDASLNESILVGLLIEDLDINDLEIAISETDQQNIASMYENLKCGSMNHLRSFHEQAIAAGITYAPEFISDSEFESIINSPKTGCNPK
ncbi:DUF2202 domain-containing protein [Algoriphagus namhaensis]|uniref:DUF2202 domain-containing protein n=1 Tax=Algoriphagus namhaensis TaxID=915353 RepID=A0ABV8APM5_9BACT